MKNNQPMVAETLLTIYDFMVKSRLLEERLIRMCKQNQGHFWIGGPGEEAFNVSLGLQIKKGQGLEYDYLHLHYRSMAILLAMGMPPFSAILQMKNVASDPHSGGRNFSGHYSVHEWNIPPINSPIETQYLTAIGTAIAQKKHGGTGITIVNGGDAGTAEGDFASCLIWASRPSNELPILIIVTNNNYGISTHASTQHGEKYIADRGKAFGIKTMVVDGLDVEESYSAIQTAMHYVRHERKPFLLEANVSRLYGHSSASGANFQPEEKDPLDNIEEKLIDSGLLSKEQIDYLNEKYNQEFILLLDKAKDELQPEKDTIYDYTYWKQKGRYW